MRYLPNILTLVRLAMVPLFPILYFSSIQSGKLFALLIYLLASITDILDGYIARKYDVVTKVGIVLDPLADKLMLLVALLSLYIDKRLPLLILLLMVLKELSLILSGIYLYFRKERTVIPANKLGKLATVLFFIAVAYLILGSSKTVGLGIVLVAFSFKLIAFSSYVHHYFKKVRQSK